MNESFDRLRSMPPSGTRTRSVDGTDHRRLARRESIRHLRRFGIGVASLVSVSGTARAHGSIGHGGDPVAFAFVIGLPVLAGLGVGAVLLTYRWGSWTLPADRRLGVAFGLLLGVLGVTLAMAVVREGHELGIAFGVLGLLMVLWIGRREGTGGLVEHAEITLAAISVHRVVEGVALGALYKSGVVVGLVAAIGIASHTAIETAAVGGLYSTYRHKLLGAVMLIQISYVVGALFGIGATILVPPSLQVRVTALVGGILLGIGVHETRHSIHAGARDRLGKLA